jgi:site-specific DNA-cytosine methylase
MGAKNQRTGEHEAGNTEHSTNEQPLVTPQRSASPNVMAYYNENDKFAAAWLRELIKAGHIAQGEVDERSIADVRPNDLRGYTQHHFFAGIGLWSRALRLAGWPDSRSCWSGSAPCQSFSGGGKRKGFADERHLWPAFFHLIAECRPSVVFGEQVKEAIKFGWLDNVQDDLEGIGYKTWAHGLAACNLGAPHQRQRLFFVADSGCERERHEPRGMGAAERQAEGGEPQVGDKAEDAEHGGAACALADADQRRLEGPGSEKEQGSGGDAVRRGAACALGDSQYDGLDGIPELGGKEEGRGMLEPEGSGAVVGKLGRADRNGQLQSEERNLPLEGTGELALGQPSEASGMADSDEQRGEPHGDEGSGKIEEAEKTQGRHPIILPRGGSAPRCVGGFWADAEWLWFPPLCNRIDVLLGSCGRFRLLCVVEIILEGCRALSRLELIDTKSAKQLGDLDHL